MIGRVRCGRPLAALGLALALIMVNGCVGSGSTETQQPVELTVLTTVVEVDRNQLDRLVAAFEAAHTNVRVRIKEGDFSQLFTSDGMANDAVLQGVDVVILNSPLAIPLARGQKLRDLGTIHLPRLDPVITELFEESSRVDGRRVTIPFHFSPFTLGINETMLNQVGVDVPPMDWTLSEFEETLRALRTAGDATDLPLVRMLDPLLRSFGGQFYDPGTDQWQFDSPEVRQGLAWMARLTQEKLLSLNLMPEIRVGDSDAPAFQILPAGLPGNLPVTRHPFPRGPKGLFIPVFPIAAGVLTTSAHPETGMQFVSEMVGSAGVQMALAQAGIRPLTGEDRAMAAWRTAVGERNADAIDQSLRGAYVPDRVSWITVVEGLKPYWEGTESLDQLLPELLEQLQGQAG